MKKYLSYLLLCFTLCFIFSGCAVHQHQDNEEEETTIDVIWEELPFQEAVSGSDLILKGTFTDKIEKHENYLYFEFQVDDVLFGNYKEDTIFVYEIFMDQDILNTYKAGEQYYLLLNKGGEHISNEHPHYVSPGAVLPVGGPYTYRDEPLDIEDMETYIFENMPEQTNAGAKEDLPRTMEDSDYIAVVTIDSVEDNEPENLTVYKAFVKEMIRSQEDLTTMEDGSILLSMQKDALEPGETCVIGFYQAGEKSIIYGQTSEDSIIRGQEEMDQFIEKMKTK